MSADFTERHTVQEPMAHYSTHVEWWELAQEQARADEGLSEPEQLNRFLESVMHFGS